MTKQIFISIAFVMCLSLANLATAATDAVVPKNESQNTNTPPLEKDKRPNDTAVNSTAINANTNSNPNTVGNLEAPNELPANAAPSSAIGEASAQAEIPNLTKGSLKCPQGYSPTPFIALGAKKKLADRTIEDIPLGCILFANNTETLNDKAVEALNDVVALLMKLNNVVRVYINLPAASSFPTRADEKHFRRRAFVIKQFLTDKGIYAHLENNATLLAEAEKIKKKPIKNVKTAKASKPKAAKPKPAETEKFAIQEITINPILFPQPARGPFQFVPLQHINFDSDKSILTASSKKILDATARYIANTSTADRILIIGHTDEAGSNKYNEGLGDRRAIAVKEYLAKLGVPPGMLVITGRGERHPVDENWTPEGRTRNRHVEVHIVLRGLDGRTASVSTSTPSPVMPL